MKNRISDKKGNLYNGFINYFELRHREPADILRACKKLKMEFLLWLFLVIDSIALIVITYHYEGLFNAYNTSAASTTMSLSILSMDSLCSYLLLRVIAVLFFGLCGAMLHFTLTQLDYMKSLYDYTIDAGRHRNRRERPESCYTEDFFYDYYSCLVLCVILGSFLLFNFGCLFYVYSGFVEQLNMGIVNVVRDRNVLELGHKLMEYLKAFKIYYIDIHVMQDIIENSRNYDDLFINFKKHFKVDVDVLGKYRINRVDFHFSQIQMFITYVLEAFFYINLARKTYFLPVISVILVWDVCLFIVIAYQFEGNMEESTILFFAEIVYNIAAGLVQTLSELIDIIGIIIGELYF